MRKASFRLHFKVDLLAALDYLLCVSVWLSVKIIRCSEHFTTKSVQKDIITAHIYIDNCLDFRFMSSFVNQPIVPDNLFFLQFW